MAVTLDGIAEGYIVDGSSPGHTTAVSVVAPSAMEADALSTAVMV